MTKVKPKQKKKVVKKKVDKSEKKFVEYLEGLVKKWNKVLLTDMYGFTIKKARDCGDAYMQCAPNYPYLNPTLYYSDRSYDDWKVGKFNEEVIIHEMVHPITWNLYEKAMERFVSKEELRCEMERLTDVISTIIWKNRNSSTKR